MISKPKYVKLISKLITERCLLAVIRWSISLKVIPTEMNYLTKKKKFSATTTPMNSQVWLTRLWSSQHTIRTQAHLNTVMQETLSLIWHCCCNWKMFKLQKALLKRVVRNWFGKLKCLRRWCWKVKNWIIFVYFK